MSLTMADSIRNPALDGQSRFGEIVTILSVFSAISTIAVGMRCYARLFILRCFGRDDGVMVAAQVLTIGSAAAIGVGKIPQQFKTRAFVATLPRPTLTGPNQRPTTDWGDTRGWSSRRI